MFFIVKVVTDTVYLIILFKDMIEIILTGVGAFLSKMLVYCVNLFDMS